MAYDIRVDSCQALFLRSLMRSHSSSGSWGCEEGVGSACAGFHSQSLSAAPHAGRRGEGVGERLLGYLFTMLWVLGGGKGAFQRLVMRVGDWLFETRGVVVFALTEGKGACPSFG